MAIHLSYLDIRQGAAKQRSETYMEYDERAAKVATQLDAKSTSGASGSARKQAGAIRW